jgi:polar amino acid transport system substrate-binding protein
MHTVSIHAPRIAAAVLAALLGSVYTAAAADGAVDRARQRGKLVAAVDYVVPEYKAGTKFRTPEAIDTVLAEDAAKLLNLPLTTVRADPKAATPFTPAGKADIALAVVTDANPLRNAIAIPTGYRAGPMAIMRTDTTIKTWEHLKDRKVCVAEGGRYVGTIASKYGAIEQVYKSPTDALLNLRIGTCDAAVHDDVLLEEMLKLPEWKKFSARLPTGPRHTLVLAVPAGDTRTETFLRQVTAEWRSSRYLNKHITKAARSIAFEIYLDQDVPDCH